jgi:hypothetical protein
MGDVRSEINTGYEEKDKKSEEQKVGFKVESSG